MKENIISGHAGQGAAYLYWIPLGAGRHVVRISGKIFEALSALRQGRTPNNLYHAALEVNVPKGRFLIEQAPAWDMPDHNKGVVAEGSIGMHWLGNHRLFRYEIRCWKDGIIPDLAFAVGSPIKVTDKLETAERIIAELPCVPTALWGRDENQTGEMWNSNSVISWVLTRSGIDLSAVSLPKGGRAPGWNAGSIVALREQRELGKKLF